MALLGHGETSDLSPLSAPKGTLIDDTHRNSIGKRTGDCGRSDVRISSFAWHSGSVRHRTLEGVPQCEEWLSNEGVADCSFGGRAYCDR